MKRLCFILMLSSMAFGQGGVFVPTQQALTVVNGITAPLPNATITVCAANASGIPCAPALVGALFKDAALTQPLTNPFFATSLGNYVFAIAPGNYTVTVTGLGFAGYSYQTTAPLSATANNTFSGANSFPGTNTFTGNLIATAGQNVINAVQLSGCQHVNASQSFAGALAATATTGCIIVDPGAYTVSSSATIPAGVGLAFSKSGILSIATGVTLTVNSPIYASPDVQVFSYVGSGVVAIGGNNGVVSSGWFPGADMCAQINNAFAAYQRGSARGGVVDARQYTSGNQPCSSNMFASITVSGQLLFGIYTIQTTVSQVIPTKMLIDGAGRGDSGSFGTVIQAVAGFPTGGTPVIQWGSGPPVGARLRNVTIDCNNITAAIGVQNLTAQEESGMSYGIIRDCPGGDLDVETTAAQNSGPWDNLELVQTALCTNCGASSFPAKFLGATPSRGLKSSTINVSGVPTPPSALVVVSSNAGSFEDLNIENAAAADGILVSSLGGGANGVVFKNIACFTLTNCIHISNLQTPSNIAILGISNTGSVTNLVKDDQTGRTVTVAAQNSGKLGWYMLGEGSLGAAAPVFTDALGVLNTIKLAQAGTSQKAETGAADANVLTLTPAATAATYRACFVASVSSATAGVISWTLSWTDSNGNAQSNIAQDLFQDGTAAPATTFTTSAAGNYHFCRELDVNNAAASIIVKWVGGGTTAAKVSATIERII